MNDNTLTVEIHCPYCDSVYDTVVISEQLRAAQARIAELEREREAILHAAHMPEDYPHGCAAWINMELYASYIGAKVPKTMVEQIESGALIFPNAPVYLRVRQSDERVKVLEETILHMSDATIESDMDAETSAMVDPIIAEIRAKH